MTTVAQAIEISDDKALERRIVKSLKSRRGKATLADVVVDTGLPNIEAERLMRRMIGEYPCHLEVTDDGDILYQFDPGMRRTESIGRWSRFWGRVGARSWVLFGKFMKALIAIVMVLYVVLFMVLIIAAMVAAQRGDQNSSSSRRGPSMGGNSGGSFWFWYFMFGRPRDPWRRHERHNPTYSRWGRGKSRTGKDDRPFYLKVYSFVLGPEPGDIEPLDDDRALLAYVREKGGSISSAEASSRTGWSLEKSEQALTRMVARYEGNIAISDDGQLVFTFAELRKTAGSKRSKAAPAFWARGERKLPLTGNSRGTNTLVGVLNSFNMLAALAAPSMILPPLQIEPTGFVMFGIHYFPLGFSAAVFLIPLVRLLLHVRPENARRRLRNFRRGFYAVVYKARRRGIDWITTVQLADKTKDQLPSGAYAPEASQSALERVVTRWAPELGGDLTPEDGEDVGALMGWRFDEVVDGYAAAAELRRALESEDAEVRVVFSTEHRDASEDLSAAIEEAASETREARVLH